MPNQSKQKQKKVEGRESITARNRATRRLAAERRQAKLIARTQALIGQHVEVRVKDHIKPLVGTVLEIVDKSHKDYPHDAKRNMGRYLRVRTSFADILVSRHRVKPIRDK